MYLFVHAFIRNPSESKAKQLAPSWHYAEQKEKWARKDWLWDEVCVLCKEYRQYSVKKCSYFYTSHNLESCRVCFYFCCLYVWAWHATCHVKPDSEICGVWSWGLWFPLRIPKLFFFLLEGSDYKICCWEMQNTWMVTTEVCSDLGDRVGMWRIPKVCHKNLKCEVYWPLLDTALKSIFPLTCIWFCILSSYYSYFIWITLV